MNILSHIAQSDYYDYDYNYSSSPSDDAAAGAAMAVFFVFYIIALIVTYVVTSLLLGMIFKKAGVPQWVAWVPGYNIWKTYQLGDQPGWWTILLFIPIVNIVAAVFYYIASYNIGLKLQKEGWFVLLAIFLPIVWLAWLAFDSSKWQGKGEAPKFAPAKKEAASAK